VSKITEVDIAPHRLSDRRAAVVFVVFAPRAGPAPCAYIIADVRSQGKQSFTDIRNP
jgi:hypothetical protein